MSALLIFQNPTRKAGCHHDGKKNAVADDGLGTLGRKIAELHRRLLEGTLDPQRVEEGLQQIVEGGGGELAIEKLSYVLSGRIHSVTVNGMDVQTWAKTIEIIEGQYRPSARANETHTVTFPAYSGPRRAKLRLGQIIRRGSYTLPTTNLTGRVQIPTTTS